MPDNAPLLFVHGFPLDHTMWRHQVERFGSSRLLLAPDLNGFGGSPFCASDEPMTTLRYADDLALLVEQVAPGKRVTLCGLSMGGYIAFQFWRHHRRLLDRLVLCDTRAIADTPEGREGRKQLAAKILAEGPSAAAEAMLPKLFAERTRAERPEVIEETRAAILRATPQGLVAALDALACRPDVTDWLPEIDVPTLVIVGEQDAISSPAEMEGLAAAIPGARFEVIPGAGHMTPLENPAAFNAALEAALS